MHDKSIFQMMNTLVKQNKLKMSYWVK